MARNGKALVTVPDPSSCDRMAHFIERPDFELYRRGNARGAQMRLSRAIAGGRFLGFRGLLLRLRRRRHLDAIHLRKPAALEVIDAGPRAALIAYDRGAIAVGVPAELDAVRRAGASNHLAFGHAKTDTLAGRGRVTARSRCCRTAAIGIDQIAVADRAGLSCLLQVGIGVARAAAGHVDRLPEQGPRIPTDIGPTAEHPGHRQ